MCIRDRYTCDQNWVKFHSMIFEICGVHEVFGTHRLTHRRTDTPEKSMTPGTQAFRWRRHKAIECLKRPNRTAIFSKPNRLESCTGQQRMSWHGVACAEARITPVSSPPRTICKSLWQKQASRVVQRHSHQIDKWHRVVLRGWLRMIIGRLPNSTPRPPASPARKTRLGLKNMNIQLDSMRWFSQRRSPMSHFGEQGVHTQGAMIDRYFCTMHPPTPSFIILCLLVRKLSCWQTNKQTDAAENIQRSSLRYDVTTLSNYSCLPNDSVCMNSPVSKMY